MPNPVACDDNAGGGGGGGSGFPDDIASAPSAPAPAPSSPPPPADVAPTTTIKDPNPNGDEAAGDEPPKGDDDMVLVKPGAEAKAEQPEKKVASTLPTKDGPGAANDGSGGKPLAPTPAPAPAPDPAACVGPNASVVDHDQSTTKSAGAVKVRDDDMVVAKHRTEAKAEQPEKKVATLTRPEDDGAEGKGKEDAVAAKMRSADASGGIQPAVPTKDGTGAANDGSRGKPLTPTPAPAAAPAPDPAAWAPATAKSVEAVKPASPKPATGHLAAGSEESALPAPAPSAPPAPAGGSHNTGRDSGSAESIGPNASVVDRDQSTTKSAGFELFNKLSREHGLHGQWEDTDGKYTLTAVHGIEVTQKQLTFSAPFFQSNFNNLHNHSFVTPSASSQHFLNGLAKGRVQRGNFDVETSANELLIEGLKGDPKKPKLTKGKHVVAYYVDREGSGGFYPAEIVGLFKCKNNSCKIKYLDDNDMPPKHAWETALYTIPEYFMTTSQDEEDEEDEGGDDEAFEALKALPKDVIQIHVAYATDHNNERQRCGWFEGGRDAFVSTTNLTFHHQCIDALDVEAHHSSLQPLNGSALCNDHPLYPGGIKYDLQCEKWYVENGAGGKKYLSAPTTPDEDGEGLDEEDVTLAELEEQISKESRTEGNKRKVEEIEEEEEGQEEDRMLQGKGKRKRVRTNFYRY